MGIRVRESTKVTLPAPVDPVKQMYTAALIPASYTPWNSGTASFQTLPMQRHNCNIQAGWEYYRNPNIQDPPIFKDGFPTDFPNQPTETNANGAPLVGPKITLAEWCIKELRAIQ